jgi:glucose/arabinose dehydrogenase
MLILTLPAACVTFDPPRAEAALVPIGFTDQGVTGGLASPTNFDFLPDGRVLIVEQRTAMLRVVGDGKLSTAGTIPDVESAAYEQGLLGVAVDPRWPEKPYVYVHYTAASTPNIRVTRFALSGDLTHTGNGGLTLDLASARHILGDLPDDNTVHNGGTLLFGGDGFLYVGLGDDLVTCAGQDIHELRGKILRIDVSNVPDGPGPTPTYQSLAVGSNPFIGDLDPRARLVWQFGLRNPFTFDLDPATGAILIGDVGETEFEELDITTEGGRNFGWPWYEGPAPFDYIECPDDTSTMTGPSYWYRHLHPTSPATIILGGICRPEPDSSGSFPAGYDGNVFIVDYFEGAIRRLLCESGECISAGPVPGQPTFGAWATGLFLPARMRFGPDGSLWYVTSSELRRICAYEPGPIGVGEGAPDDVPAIRAAFPMPARDVVTLTISLPAAGRMGLEIFDAAGRRIRRLARSETYSGGTHHVLWDGRADDGSVVAPGIFFARLQFMGRTSTRRLLLLGERG